MCTPADLLNGTVRPMHDGTTWNQVLMTGANARGA